MNPSQVSSELRHIASKISASDHPDPQLVSQDLQRVVMAVEEDDPKRYEGEEAAQELTSRIAWLLERGRGQGEHELSEWVDAEVRIDGSQITLQPMLHDADTGQANPTDETYEISVRQV